MKVLFVCNQGLHRSKTAELLFKDEFETRSAALFNEERMVKAKDIEWADLVVVMDDAQRKELSVRFPKLYLKKRILSLDIPDVYSFNQPQLKQLLKSKLHALA